MGNPKVLCNECDWHGLLSETLHDEHPFRTDEILRGCPTCGQIQDFQNACDEKDCWKPVSYGTPTAAGYRQTCGEHCQK